MDEKKKLSLKEIQKASLQVLIKFDLICTNLGLSYFLMYGSLLGAIRSNDFIPWDDDVDVMMPRKDFDRFVEYAIANEENLYPFKLHTRENTKNYFYGIPRFSDMRYKYNNIDKSDLDLDIGVFIDVYPWDNFGESDKKSDKIWNKCKRINAEYSHYVIPRVSDDKIIKKAIRLLYYYFLRFIKGKAYNRKVDNRIKRIVFSQTSDSDRYIGLVVWGDRILRFEKKELLDMKTELHYFAGYSFKIPSAYDYILRTHYGDYLKLPPLEKRKPSHDYYIFRR